MVSTGAANLRVHGRRLIAFRLAWAAVAVLTFGLFVSGIPPRFDQLLRIATEYKPALLELGLSVEFYAAYVTALDLAIVMTHFAIAAVIFWRAPDDRMALFVSFTLIAAPLSFIKALGGVQPAWRLLTDCVNYLGLVSSLSLLYLFPDGRFVPPWTRPLAVLWAGINLAAVFFPATPLSLSRWPVALQAILLLAWSGSGMYAQTLRYVAVSDPVQRQQTRWALIGLTAAALGPIAYHLPFFTLPSLSQLSLPGLFYELAGPTVFTLSLLYRLVSVTAFTLAMLLFPLSFAVAILRYRLWDIDLLINRTVVYGAVTATLALTYVAIVLFLQDILRPLTIRFPPELATAVSTLAVAALFSPLRRRVQASVDRRYYRRKYDAERNLAAFSATLRDIVDVNKLTHELLAVIQETFEPTHVSLWLRKDPAGWERGATVRQLAPRTASPGVLSRETTPIAEIGPDDDLLVYLQATRSATEIGSLRLESVALHALRAAGIELTLPLISQTELIGLLNLGPRRGPAAGYSTDDHRLLNQVAPQAAAALRVAQLAHVEQELRVARLIQQTLLPGKLPVLPGWQMAAYYEPARAVGGDFYDFIELQDGRLALVIGDVADKGVPAALVMANTRSMLRAASQQSLSAGAVLERVNDLLFPDMLPRMFATCLYAILDPSSGRLHYANAGHSLPMRRGENGVDELRATGMPLGLMPNMKYEEQETMLAAGDRVLFYSDGLVEAHNPQREMFGGPRLRSLVADGALYPAEPSGAPLIQFVLDRLRHHVGAGWDQEDDVTLVSLERIASPGGLSRGDAAV